MADKSKTFEKAILVAQSDNHASIERKALKNAGFRQVSIFTSGVELAYYLADVQIDSLQRKDLIFCQSEFSDMNACEFLNIIRLHPLLTHQPFVGISGNKEEATLMEECGFIKILNRPIDTLSIQRVIEYCYNFTETNRKAIQNMIAQGRQIPDTMEFYAQLDAQNAINSKRKNARNLPTAYSILNEGLAYAKEANYEKAVPLLAKASVEEDTAPKAYETLALIYGKQKNIEQVEKYLKESIKANAYIGDYQRLLDLSYKFKQKFPNAKFPLVDDYPRYLHAGGEKIRNLTNSLRVLNELYPVKETFSLLLEKTSSFINKDELISALSATIDDESNSTKIFNELLIEKGFGYLVKNIDEEKPKNLAELANTSSSFGASRGDERVSFIEEALNKTNRYDEFEILKDIKANPNSDVQWGKIGKISNIDEVSSFDYSLNTSQPKSMLVSIIKGTHHLYKSMNKARK